MKTFALSLILALSVCTADAKDLSQLLVTASATNSTYLLMTTDLELAELRFEKSRIEANGERAILAAESTMIQARDTYRRSLVNFTAQVIDALFDTAIADINLRIALLNQASVADEQSGAERQFDRGLISEENLTEARLALRSAQLATNQARWDYNDGVEQLLFVSGITWDAGLLPDAPAFQVSNDLEKWSKHDHALQRAALGERIAGLDVAALPGNASRYDRLIAEAAGKKAKMDLEQAERGSIRSYRIAALSLKNDYETMLIRADELTLQMSLSADAERRYEQSIIPRSQLSQQQVRYLNAERTYLQAKRNYLRDLLSYLIAIDEFPADL